MAQSRRNTLQTILIRLSLGLGGVLFGCVVLEIGVRFLPPPDNPFRNFTEDYICSPTVGWLGRPDHQNITTGPGYSHPFHFNSRGMHDTDHTIEKADNVFRILWVGDSFAQALQVNEPDTAHQQLENLLNERLGSAERSFEVVSTGVGAWGTGQELVYYREQGRFYQPDLVLHLFFIGNDVDNNLPEHALTLDGFNCYAPYFPICNDGTIDREPWPYIPGLNPAWGSCSSAYKWLLSGLSLVQQNSHLFTRIEPVLLSITERRTFGKEFGLSYAALYLKEESEEVQYAWQVAQGLLAQFNNEVKADEADFAVAVISPLQVILLSQLDEAGLQAFYQTYPVFANAEIDRPNRQLATFLQSQKIPVLDLRPPMTDHIAQTGAQLFYPLDRHWTVEGNRFVAEVMFEWLIENQLVSVSN